MSGAKKSHSLLRYFLAASPHTHRRQVVSFRNVHQPWAVGLPKAISDRAYLRKFLNRMEVVGPSAAFMVAHSPLPVVSLTSLSPALPPNAYVERTDSRQMRS